MNWKNLQKLATLLLVIICLIPDSSFSQDITAPGADYAVVTQYKEEQPLGSGNWVAMPANEQDSVFVFCSDVLNGGCLTAPAGTSYQWGKYEPSQFQYVNFATTQNVCSLESGGYKVVVTTGTAKACYYAWVFVNQTIADLNNIAAGCAPFNLSGVFDNVSDFTVYSPPDDPFTIDANTQIEVCFTATHTYVSDLGFYLVAPGFGAGCSGTPAQPGQPGIVELIPAVSSWDDASDLPHSVISCTPSEINTVCNSGNNLNNFCFTTAEPFGNPAYTACVCDLPTPLTGLFASAGPWSTIYNQQVPAPIGTAANCGWSVQIYDCEPIDDGYFTNATIKFTGTGVCGQATHFYDSGTISSYISDGSCDAISASRYVIPPASPYQYTVSNTITSAVLSCSPGTWDTANWGSSDFLANSSARTINPPPSVNTWFYLTVTDNFGCVKVDSTLFETLPTDATITHAGPFCTNSGQQQLNAVDQGGVWTSVPAGLIVNASNGTIDPSIGAGVYEITYTISGVCPDVDIDTIIVNPVISIQNYTDTLCVNSSTQYVIAFDIFGGTGFTVSVDGGATFSSAYVTGNHFEYTANSGQNVNFFVTSLESCDTLEGNAFHDCGCQTNAGVMSPTPIVICQGASATSTSTNSNLQLNDNLVYYLHTGNLNAIINPIDSNFTGTFPTNGLIPIVYGQQYYISAVAADSLPNGYIDWTDGCKYVSVGTPVKWLQNPTADAGPVTIDVCGYNAQLGATVPTVGQGAWSSTNCPLTTYNPYNDDPNAVTSVSSTGSCTYKWTVSNGSCVASDNVIVTYYQEPNPFAGNDTTVCGISHTLIGTLSLPGGQSNGTWSGGPGTNITNIPPNKADVTVSNYGTYTFTFTEDVNGLCNEVDYVKITFVEKPTPFAGNNDSVCYYAGSYYYLNALNVQYGGEWSCLQSGQIFYSDNGFVPPTKDPQAKVKPSITGNSQTLSFVWHETNGQCDAYDTLLVNFAIPPFAEIDPATSDQYVCGMTSNLNANITGSPYTNAIWYTKFPGVVFSNNDSISTTVTIPGNSGIFGDSSYVEIPVFWLMKNQGCDDIDTLDIRFFETSGPNAGVDTTACGLVLDSLNAKFGLGDGTNANGSWNQISGPGVATFRDHVSDAILPLGSDDMDKKAKVSVDIYGEYEFVWSVTNDAPGTVNLINPCINSDTIKVKFVRIPFIDAGDPINICGGLDIYLNPDTSTVKDSCIWITHSGISYHNQYSPVTGLTPNTGLTGEFYLTYREWVDICIVEDSVKIIIVPQPTAITTIPMNKRDVCGPLYITLTAQVPTGGTIGYWMDSTLVSTTTTFTQGNHSNPDSALVTLYGTHNFYWITKNTINNFSCYDTSDVVPITFWPLLNPDAGVDSVIACGNYFALTGVKTVDSSTVVWSCTDADLTFQSTGYVLEYGTAAVDSVYIGQINTGRDIKLTEKIGPNGMCSASDVINVYFAPVPNGEFTFVAPKCYGGSFMIQAVDNSLVGYGWDFNGGIIDSVSVQNDHGEGPLYVSWDSDSIHSVTLVDTNSFNCPSLPVTHQLNEPPIIEINFNVTDAECSLNNGSITTWATGGLYPAGGYTYEWGAPITDNVNNQTQDSLALGRYIVTVTDYWKCKMSDTTFIDNLGLVTASFDTTNFEASYNAPASISFTNMSVDAVSYQWYFNNSNNIGLFVDIKNVWTNNGWYTFNPKIQLPGGAVIDSINSNPTFEYEDGGDFWVMLIAISDSGCVDTMYYEKIHVEYRPMIDVPNVFTPNGDGINDLFTIKVKSLESFSGIIFNRWGHKVYEWNDPDDAGWDGKINGGSLASPGTYYYIIQGVGKDGTEFSPKTDNCEKCKGFLQLIRD